MRKINVGLDISMDSFWATISILNDNLDIEYLKNKDFSNTNNGFKAMLKWIDEVGLENLELHFTMEATGVYYENLAYFLDKKTYIVHVVLPNKAKKFMESLDINSKTDKLDSRALGQLGIERKLRIWKPISPSLKIIKELTRERGRLVKIRSQLKNNLHALDHTYKINEATINRLKSLIDVFSIQVKEIEKELKEKTKKDKYLQKKIDKIITIPGIGITTALIVIAETNGFSMMENSKQLSSYAGLDVREQQSGTWKGKSQISKKGNSHLRGALYFPALTTIKYSKHYKSFYERILHEKKKSKIGLTAVSRKLLILMFSLWKNDTVYQEDYKIKNAA